MKNQQKGSTTVILLVVIIVLLVIAFGAYIFKNNQSSQDVSISTETSPSVTVTNSTTSQESDSPKIYSDKEFGFSMTYPRLLVLTTDVAGEVNLKTPDSQTNPTTIEKMTGSADDSNGKFGKYIISYSNNGWVVKFNDDCNGDVCPHADPITPAAYTTSGLPIFYGGTRTHGWGRYGYIVALSHTKFLVINGPEGLNSDGSWDQTTDPTFSIVKSISVQ